MSGGTFRVSVPRQGPSGTGRNVSARLFALLPRLPDLPKDKYLRALHYALWNTFLLPLTLLSVPGVFFSTSAGRASRIIIAICVDAWQILPGPSLRSHPSVHRLCALPFFNASPPTPAPLLHAHAREYLFPSFEHSPDASLPSRLASPRR